MCVTAKGYPDFATRKFLILIQRLTNAKFFYIGDADPYGAEIFFTYLYGSPKFAL
jgi:meiotic recombination protein SPO11